MKFSKDDLSIVMQELEADDSPQRRIALLGLHLTATLIRKNKNYGNSALTPSVLAPDVPPGTAIRVRMSDKIKRILSLEAGDPDRVGESLVDTYVDFAGYSILLVLEAMERLTKAENTCLKCEGPLDANGNCCSCRPLCVQCYKPVARKKDALCQECQSFAANPQAKKQENE